MNEIIFWFLVSLFATLIVTRICAHKLHDRNGYRKENGDFIESSKTLTAYLRKRTRKDLHHIHIGFGILLVAVPWIIHSGIGRMNIFFLGIGLSLVIDQLLPFFKFGNYFSKKMLRASIILHLLIAILGIIILRY